MTYAAYGEAIAIIFGFGMILGLHIGAFLANRAHDLASAKASREEMDALTKEDLQWQARHAVSAK